MQETRLQSLIQEDPTYLGAAKPVRPNYWACALEPGNHNYGAHVPELVQPLCPGAHALQQEKPPQWETLALQLESSLHSLKLEKSPHSSEDSAQPKIKLFFKVLLVDCCMMCTKALCLKTKVHTLIEKIFIAIKC